jgi:hypothetical protein
MVWCPTFVRHQTKVTINTSDFHPAYQYYTDVSRGVGSFEKLGGGQALSGTFRRKKGHLKIFFGNPPPPGQCTIFRSVYHFRSQKFFPNIPQFFPKYEKNFPLIPINFLDIWYLSPKFKYFSANNIDWSFQKCPLGKKCNFNENFSRKKKGTLLPEKGHLPKLGGGGWPPLPPGSYAPGCQAKKGIPSVVRYCSMAF